MNLLDEDTHAHIEQLSEHVKQYLDTRWDIIVLNISERMLSVASGLITGLFLTFFGSIALIFISIGGAIYIGRELNNPAAGYLIMAGFFIIVLVLTISLARQYVRTVIANSILNSIKDDDDEKTS